MAAEDTVPVLYHEISTYSEKPAVSSNPTQRIILNLLLNGCNICLYINRVSISSAVVYMYTSDSDRSVVLSSFYWGYMLSQIPAAMLVTRFGAKVVLMNAVLLWSFAAFMTVVAYDLRLGLWPVVATRVILGLAEGANYPCQGALVTSWIPDNEISRTTTIIVTGENIGTILAMLGAPFLIENYGFRMVFWFSGAFGLAWLIPFFWIASDTPASSLRDLSKIRTKTAWRKILSTFTFWVLVITHICFNWAYYVGLSWLPDYFDDQFSVNLDHLGFYTVLPYIAIFVVANVAGWIADAMLGCWRKSSVRRLMNTVGLLSAALFFYLIGTVKKDDDPSCSGQYCLRAVLFLTVAIATSGLGFPGYWASLLELSPPHASAIVSISNSIATLPGILGNLVTGLILSDASGEAKDWGKVFFLCALLLVCGAIIFLLFSERNPPIQLEDNVAVDRNRNAAVAGD